MVLLMASGIGFAFIVFIMYYHIYKYAAQSAAPLLLQHVHIMTCCYVST